MPDVSVFFLNLMSAVGFRTLPTLAGNLALVWLVLRCPVGAFSERLCF